MEERDLVRYGKLGRPHGVRGEVRFFAYNVESRLLEELEGLWLMPPRGQGEVRWLELDTVRRTPKFWLLSFVGLMSREDVAAITNWELGIGREEFPQLAAEEEEEEREYYQADLIGLEVFEVDEAGEPGRRLGAVRGFMESGAGDLIIVEDRRSRYRLLAPMLEGVVAALEPEEGRVLLCPLESWAWEGADGEG